MADMIKRGVVFASVVLLQVLFSSTPVTAWSYEDIDEWNQETPLCGSTAQSPIDIVPGNTQFNQFTDPLTFKNYDSPLEYTEYEELNNGHTMVTSFSNNSQNAIRVSGGGLGDNVFALQQYHFHWGSQQDLGSEHTINGDHYSMEIHLVHFNTTLGDYNTASALPGGLAVLGTFVLIGDSDNPTFEKILSVFKEIKYKNQGMETPEKFALRGLLPTNTQDFYRYEGSLTTPPCYQTVTWTLFRNPIYISLRQLNEFRNLHEEEPDDDEDKNTTSSGREILLVDNYRSLQPLNNRIVQRSFQLNQDWFYDDTTFWQLHYPMCDGTSQSPIDINSQVAVASSNLTNPLSFIGFSSAKSINLVNTGFTVEGRLSSSSAPTLAGGVFGQGTNYVLYLISLRFSLTGDNVRGSEHSIDGSKYPLEMQLLFYNSKYSNGSVAEHYKDGVAGLAIFGQVQDGASLPLLDAVTNVKVIGSQYSTSLSVDSLLPRDCCKTLTSDSENLNQEYYSYSGSMTTPSCEQTVTWIVLPKPVSFSSAQFNALRSIDLKLTSSAAQTNSTGPSTPSSIQTTLTNNCRPAQRLNERKVVHYSQTNGKPSSATQLSTSSIAFLLAAFAFKL